MTTPAERLRRALPPKPKGGYEPGTVAADTVAVLDENQRVLAERATLHARIKDCDALWQVIWDADTENLDEAADAVVAYLTSAPEGGEHGNH